MNKINVFILAITLVFAAQLSAQNQEAKPYIEIETEVERKVVPDRIYLSLQVRATKSKSIDKIEQQVVTKLAKIGIDEDRIFLNDAESDLVKVWYKKKFIEDQKEYRILVYNTPELSKCMETLDMEGVENLRISHSEYSEKEALKLEMIAEAMQKAKHKAQVMLTAIDEELGKPLMVRENNAFARSYETMQAKGVRTATFADANAEPNISFQKHKYQIRVYVRFAIKSAK